MPETPIVDRRDGDDVLEEARGIAPYYTDRWDPDSDDVGATLLALFSEMAEDVIERLNQVPEKHRIAFFDTLGFSRDPPQPSRLPVTFQVTDDIDENVAIPEGTQAVAPARGERPEQLFEIPDSGGFEGTPATIEAVYTVDPGADDVFSHWDSLTEGVETELFTGKDLQKHVLNIGHADALNLKSESKIWVEVGTDAQSVQSAVFTDRLKWEFFGEVETDDGKKEDWHLLEDVALADVSGGTVTVRLEFPKNTTETKEKKIGEVTSRWIRCRIPTDEELRDESRAYSPKELFDVEVRSVSLSLVAPADEDDTGGIPPDDLLSGDVPLEAEPDEGEVVDIHPFGEAWPLRNTFYVASEEAFTKEGVTVNLEFSARTRKSANGAGEASITFNDQESNGITVTVDSVTVPRGTPSEGAYVVIREPTAAETITGASAYLEPGTYENVELNLDLRLRSETGLNLTALLYRATEDEKPDDHVFTEDPLATDTAEITPFGGRDPLLSWEYWNGEGWARLDDLKDGTNELRRSGTVAFTVPEDLEATTAAGHEGHWIRARLVSGEYVRLAYETDLDSGEVSVSTVGVPPHFGGVHIYYDRDPRPTEKPDHLVTYNNLDYSADLAETLESETPAILRPFYGLPDEKQTLYVGFDGELRDGPINLLFSLADKEYPDGFYPRARWERCEDSRSDEWTRLDTEDGTESLTERGIVGLGFRDATVPSGRFGTKLHWIRARLDGHEFVPTTATDGPSDPVALPVAITVIDTENNRVVVVNTSGRTVDLGGYRIEFECARPDDRVWTFPDGTTLAARGFLTVGTGTEPDDSVDVQFEYDHPALDDCVTNAVAILTPGGELVTRKVEDEPEPCERWLETVPPAGEPDRTPPIARGLHPNTGWAYNVESIEGELLGSSDGTPNQEFTVSTPPVTEETVWVNELSVLSEGELRELRDARPTGIEEVTGPGEASVAFWVRWTRVEDFLDSSGDDRHYRLDPTMGRLTFGNGTRGRIPPRGADNIRIDYRTGGGAAGNVETGAVTDLISSIPFVDSVANPEPSDGGADAESVDQVVARAPKQLRDRGKAVSREDFERIAMAASRTLARARCIPAMDEAGEHSPGWVTVLIVPTDRRAKPVPSVELKHRVTEEVSKRAPATLVAHGKDRPEEDAASAPELVVRGPSYVEVSVETTVEAGNVGSISALEARVTEGVDAFLHPLTGGDRGNGWEFGELPCLSDLYALLEGIDGVDHVVDLSLTFHGDDEEITVTEGEESPNVAADTLIFSGTHTTEVDGTNEVTATGRR